MDNKYSDAIEFSPAIDLVRINADNLVTFENETIKIELKKNFSKDFLRKIVDHLQSYNFTISKPIVN